MIPLLLIAVAARWVWARAVNWRSVSRDDTEMDQLVRDSFARALDDTQPIDVVDRDWDRRDREIHGMTVPEMQETNAEFDALIAENFPNQT
jgi:hypothetical protein